MIVSRNVLRIVHLAVNIPAEDAVTTTKDLGK